MKRLYPIILLGLLTGCSGPASKVLEPSQEAAALPSIASCGALERCLQDGNIAIIGADDTAGELLLTAQKGAAQFERYFGVPAPSAAIVPGGVISPELNTQIEDAGFEVMLPWISETGRKDMAAESVRQQVMDQTKGMPEAQRDAILKMALGKLEAAQDDTPSETTEKQKGALTHELGHMWFMEAFKSPALDAETKVHSYGGWAPDWLDETAAVLLENDALTQARREAFKAKGSDELYPLRDYLSMEHPAAKSAKDLLKNYNDPESGAVNPGESRAIILTGAEGEAFLEKMKDADPVGFYTQTRAFADFMIEATNDPQLFAKIATHLAGGKSFESWLATRGDLPNTIAALDARWQSWPGKTN